MARRWFRMPIALGLVLALLVGNGVAAQGVRCLMPACKTCAPKPAHEPRGCCPEKDPAPSSCCCVASGDSHPDGVLAAAMHLPSTGWVAIAPEALVLVVSRPVAAAPPETRVLGPPGEDFHRAPCGRAPPAA